MSLKWPWAMVNMGCELIWRCIHTATQSLNQRGRKGHMHHGLVHYYDALLMLRGGQITLRHPNKHNGGWCLVALSCGSLSRPVGVYGCQPLARAIRAPITPPHWHGCVLLTHSIHQANHSPLQLPRWSLPPNEPSSLAWSSVRGRRPGPKWSLQGHHLCVCLQ